MNLSSSGNWKTNSTSSTGEFAARRTQLELELEAASPAARDDVLATLRTEELGAQLRASYAGRLGRLIEPVIEPLGFDWKIGVGLIGSFAAREVFVSTMGVVYGVGGDVDETSTTLRDRISTDTRPDGSRVFTPLVGISLMVFYALACQCVSTLGVVKRETNSWRWPVLMWVCMTALAYVVSLVFYQVGTALEWGTG